MQFVALLIPVIALLQPSAAPEFSAKLYAADQALQPGGQTELAIELTIEKGCHAYHPIVLDTGAPTSISFDVPAGISIGQLRFPTPELNEQGGLEYLELRENVVVVTTLQVAADYSPGPLPLKTTVRALVCKELCVPVTAEAALMLRVSSQPPVPADSDFFKQAREALPASLDKAKYIEGSSLSVVPEKIGPDDEAEVVLTVRVKKEHHIQDRDPGVEGLIASRLFIESLDGLEFGSQKWPEPQVRQMPGFGQVRELGGEFKIRVPLRITDAEFPSGPVALRALFTYQCCTDAGTCYPPEAAEGVVRFAADTATKRPADAAPLGSVYPTVSVVDLDALCAAVAASTPTGAHLTTVLWHLVLGFIGGLILNITPCVFPVISIKILGFVRQAHEERGRIFKLGLAFCAGIMVWFWVFGILTGLGQVPLQHPPVAIGLAAVLFVLALSLFGVYEILLPGAGQLTEAASREGYLGAFLNGFLATLLGTACTAPFFAGAAAYAATQPRATALLVFTAAGLGMCSPYLMLSAFPSWLKKLPKPGPWMATFKQVMGFVLMGTVVWLLMIIGDLLDARGVVWTLAFLCFLAFSAWLIGRIQLNWGSARRRATWLVAVGISAFGLWFTLFRMYDLRAAGQATAGGGLDPQIVAATIEKVASADWSQEIPWQPFYPGLPEELSRRGYTVYVDYTATWCVNCQTNLHTSVEIESTRRRMRELGVIPIIGDYTRPNPAIRAELLRFGHNSVPLNVIYPAGRPRDVIRLPVLLTPGIVLRGLERAGPSHSRPTDTAGLPLTSGRDVKGL